MGLNIILSLIGFVLLSYSADKLVEGASNLAINYGVSRLVIGMTIVAAGTSLPEMVVSVNASLKGNPELSLGNVVGSNIMNAALILGIAALIKPIACERQTTRREVPIMISAAGLLWLISLDGHISELEGNIMFVLFFAYIYLSYRWSKQEKEAGKDIDSPLLQEVPESPEEAGTPGWNFFFILAGMVGLVIGSESLVFGAIRIATVLGVGDEVIGLTLVAVGTSLPELATAIAASRKGQGELTVGNVVGSNIFNVLGIIGCASFVSMFVPVTQGLTVSANMLGIHIPLMVALSLGVLPIMTTGLKIIRAEGALLVGVFLIYNYILFQTNVKVYKEDESSTKTVVEETTTASDTIKLQLEDD